MSRLLSDAQLATHLDGFSAETRELILALRDLVLDAAPGVAEAIRYNALNYFLDGVCLGCIGGNVCIIDCRRGRVQLGFMHGAGLPDPADLLQGRGKHQRDMPPTSVGSVRTPALRRLIESAHAAAFGRASGASGASSA
ncbi:MAG: DUF1801 domain-containing protein [Leptolyngbya sp. PLA3]|nr:MAG: DUF1801 domain-containing protein [Cyanobacteria bacterium CYA]MCE7968531.1 DUF1801 domain-containing protein [Leptolyngbya sp. PL-A3]